MRRLLLGAACATALAVPAPSPAASAFVARSMTLTGSFVVGNFTYTVKAEARTRHIVNAPTNGDPYGFLGQNPNEVTQTVMICNQHGCDLNANRICISTALVAIDDRTNELTIDSTKPACEVHLSVDVGNPAAPRLVGQKVESIAPATFRGDATLRNKAAVGTDGRVARAVSWAVTTS